MKTFILCMMLLVSSVQAQAIYDSESIICGWCTDSIVTTRIPRATERYILQLTIGHDVIKLGTFDSKASCMWAGQGLIYSIDNNTYKYHPYMSVTCI